MMNLHVSQQVAAEELLRRRSARQRLIDFTQYTYPQYVADPVHYLIASKLDAVVRGEINRLMVFAPPQHGKSELVSVRFPAFWMGRRPDDPVILSSYGASLAHTHSRAARDTVESDEYRALFGSLSTQETPVRTRRDTRAVDEWKLQYPHRGGMRAVGVGGPITGHGARLGIIDDPFENWEQAQSLTMRERVWEWWQGTFRTRIWEGGAIILVMTRWHEDDLAGRLLNSQGEKWEVLRLPAIAETQEDRDVSNKTLNIPPGQPDPLGRNPGAALAPSRYSAEALKEIEEDVGSIVWISEYQGAPRAPKGNRFKRHWFEILPAAPMRAERVRYWDKGGTDGGGAYTAGVLLALADGIVYVEDAVRDQLSAGKREALIKQVAELDAAQYGRYGVRIYVEQEPGSGGKESADATIANLAGYSVYRDLPTGSKDVRMEPFAAQAEAGNVKLVRGPWNHDFLEEVTALPNSKYRDQSDAAAGAFNKLTSQRIKHRRGKAKI